MTLCLNCNVSHGCLEFVTQKTLDNAFRYMNMENDNNPEHENDCTHHAVIFRDIYL